MAQQDRFTLPANTRFGITAWVNAGYTQKITVYVDEVPQAEFSGSGSDDRNLGTKVVNSGKGNVRVAISANGKNSDLVSTHVILANKPNFVVIGSEDSTDNDYNDSIVFLNWPLG
ncbi:fucose-binding lectin II [Paraherbaspirillum soli]|uniref:Fucose-binding lectin II n=1 Tax=Paraherbaspirillum soli TaxID=631222 RepID=A0ABW0MCU4_9BURK